MSVILAGCKGSTNAPLNKEFRNVEPELSVWADENSGSVSCHFIFTKGRYSDKGVAIPGKGKLQLDGIELRADSSKFNGYYYDYISEITPFSKKHLLVFTDPNGDIYKDDFDFIPPVVENSLNERMSRKPFHLALKNIPERAYIRLVLTDTSFYSKDVNELVPVIDGKIEITQKMLNNLKNGQISLELFEELEKSLFKHTPYEGKFSLSYHIQREFDLTD
ncbi:MAG: hypothetical protein ACJ748_12395 [Flavisolibacter sp.]